MQAAIYLVTNHQRLILNHTKEVSHTNQSYQRACYG